MITYTTTALAFTAALLSAQPPTTQPPQQTPPPAQQTTPPPAPQQASADKIVVTGCLRNAASGPDMTATTGTAGTAGATAAGATGTTGAAPDPSQQKFVLMDATRASAAAPDASTATPDSTSRAARDTYRLIANPTALAQHVGKKLELTGTLEAANAASTDTSSGPFAGRPTLRVESGKIVGATCDQK